LLVHQERHGYRFSVDAVLLAGLTAVRPADRVLDLGTGCGVIPLIWAHRKQGGRLVGVEMQPELACLAKQNVAENGFSEKIEILEMDFRTVSEHLQPGDWDLVVSNPPYRRLNSGRINPNRQRAQARHELTGSVEDVFAAAGCLLHAAGRVAVIYPAARLAHLMGAAERHGFSPKALTVIHSHCEDSARLVHLECRKGGGEELHVAAPFFIYNRDGTYTEAMQKLYAG
jgi:tRNA1Val (adenine37-N6)-methyltransferase